MSNICKAQILYFNPIHTINTNSLTDTDSDNWGKSFFATIITEKYILQYLQEDSKGHRGQ